MTGTILLNSIEKDYQQEIEKILQTEQILTADIVIELSKKLHSNLKPKDISSKAHDDDMLLFQYGTYNWGGLLGEHFSFDITRQFSLENFDMFQLSLTLFFDPIKIESYNSWSLNFNTLEDWSSHIKTTEGYMQSKILTLRSYKLAFSKI